MTVIRTTFEVKTLQVVGFPNPTIERDVQIDFREDGLRIFFVNPLEPEVDYGEVGISLKSDGSFLLETRNIKEVLTHYLFEEGDEDEE